jgi:hypothetical protein
MLDFFAGYPGDEAASLEALTYRQRYATDLFLGYFESSKLYGVGTCILLQLIIVPKSCERFVCKCVCDC